MEAKTDHERSKNHVHEGGAPGLSGQRILPSVCIALTTRSVRTVGLQVVAHPLF